MLLEPMPLTSQQFALMAAGIRSERRGAVDRRRTARAGVRVRLEVIHIVDRIGSGPMVVFSRDLSEAGISILSDFRMNAGTHVVWDLPDADGGAPRRWGGLVRSCRRTSGEQWLVGLEFVKDPPTFTPLRPVDARAGDEAALAQVRRVRRAILD